MLDSGRTVFAAEAGPGPLRELFLLTAKPFLYVFNCDADELADEALRHGCASWSRPAEAIFLDAKIEAELVELETDEARELLAEMGVDEPGLDALARVGFDTLGLQTYLTAGPKESRAWTIRKGATAPEAAGVIHTDFQKGFIKAEVVSFDDLVEAGSMQAAKAAGKVRLEGKDYVMADGDVVEFRFNVSPWSTLTGGPLDPLALACVSDHGRLPRPRTWSGLCAFRPRSAHAHRHASGACVLRPRSPYRGAAAALALPDRMWQSAAVTLPRPEIDPDGLLEYSVVFTDRSLNHMSHALRRGDAGHHRRAADDLPRRDGRGRPGRWHLRDGGGRPAAGDRADGAWWYATACSPTAGRRSSRPARIPARRPCARPVRPRTRRRRPGPRRRSTRWSKPSSAAAPRSSFAAHVETAAGILLPDDYLRAVAAATHAVGGLIVLDCIASGALWVDMTDLGVDVLISAPQKGWSGSPVRGLRHAERGRRGSA